MSGGDEFVRQLMQLPHDDREERIYSYLRPRLSDFLAKELPNRIDWHKLAAGPYTVDEFEVHDHSIQTGLCIAKVSILISTPPTTGRGEIFPGESYWCSATATIDNSGDVEWYDPAVSQAHTQAPEDGTSGTYAPMEQEVLALPRWAQVAFAARCARRVLPLIPSDWKRVLVSQIQSLERAVGAAEFAAAQGASFAPGGHTEEMAEEAAAVAAKAPHKGPQELAPSVSYFAARAVSQAATAAARIGSRTGDAFAVVAGAAADAARAIDNVSGRDAARVIRDDFDRIIYTARAEQWADDTPVPPEFFGPLWPNGPPSGWPTEEPLAGQLETEPVHILRREPPRIAVIWDPAMISAKEYAELVTALGDVVRAAGGLGVERARSDDFGAKVGEGVLS